MQAKKLAEEEEKGEGNSLGDQAVSSPDWMLLHGAANLACVGLGMCAMECCGWSGVAGPNSAFDDRCGRSREVRIVMCNSHSDMHAYCPGACCPV
jgi:hypothetical protein